MKGNYLMNNYNPHYLLGRLRSGRDRSGTVYHAVEGQNDYGFGKALCGKQPGKRSVGWMSAGYALPRDYDGPPIAINCPRCMKKLAGLGECEQPPAVVGLD